MQNLGDEKRFTHLSVRIPSDLNTHLVSESKRQGITLNALINRTLERYLTFDRLVDFDHSVVLEEQIFERLLEHIDNEDLAKVARDIGPKVVKRDFAFFNISATLDSLVSSYFRPAGKFSNKFDINVSGEFPNVKLVLSHEHGLKWSNFLREYCEGVIESVIGARPLITAEDDVVTIDLGFRNLAL